MKKTSLFLFLIFELLLMQNNSFAGDKYNTYQFDSIKRDKKPWFEWWYYKIVVPDTNESFYFVYGVVNPWDFQNTLPSSRTYIGMGDFRENKIYEQHFNVDHFYASKKETYININQNIATDKNLYGEVVTNTGKVSWDINLEKHWSFNPVSFALGKNITDIEWYPAAASATCNGIIKTESKVIEIKDAPCYQDRNWGSIFPKWWTWIVSNSFIENKNSTLAVGGGRPTYKKTNFPFEGVSIGLQHQGIEYLFRPTDLNITTANIQMGHWSATGDNGKFYITIEANSPLSNFMDLQFITPQNEVFHDYETLTGNLKVKLFKKHLGKKHFLFELNSKLAGIEFGSRNLNSLYMEEK